MRTTRRVRTWSNCESSSPPSLPAPSLSIAHALDRMLHNPTRHCVTRFAGQRVRCAEVAVEMMNGRPFRVVRSVFNMMTFTSDGTFVPPLRDRHVRARAELALALALGGPGRHAGVAEASTPFVARWWPPRLPCWG